MTYQICPICDQKLTKPHYCTHCRTRVKKPLTINVDYYLNERHPETDHDCTYHDYDQKTYQQPISSTTTSTASRTASRTGGQIPGQVSMPFGQAGQPRTAGTSRTTTGSASGTARTSTTRTASRSTTTSTVKPNTPYRPGSTTTNRSQNTTVIIALVILVICITASMLFSMTRVLFTNMSLSLDGYNGGYSSLFSAFEETKEPEPASREYESWELTEEEVKALGQNCNSCGHFKTDADTMKNTMFSYVESLGYMADEIGEYSINNVDNYGYTYYSSSNQYSFAKEWVNGQAVGNQYIEILSDTATGQLHGFNPGWEELDEMLDILGIMVQQLEENGDWPMSGAETAKWIEELAEEIPNITYEYLSHPKLEKMGIDVFVSNDEDYGYYYISVDYWGD